MQLALGKGIRHHTRPPPPRGCTRERNHVTIPKEAPTQSFLNILIGVGVSLALLYWAKAVLIPVALALLLTFLLTPIVTTLWHWGVHRALAAVLVVGLATGLLGAVGWTVEAQLAALAAELPTYTGNIKQKIAQMPAIPGQKSASDVLGYWRCETKPLSPRVKARVVGDCVPYG